MRSSRCSTASMRPCSRIRFSALSIMTPSDPAQAAPIPAAAAPCQPGLAGQGDTVYKYSSYGSLGSPSPAAGSLARRGARCAGGVSCGAHRFCRARPRASRRRLAAGSDRRDPLTLRGHRRVAARTAGARARERTRRAHRVDRAAAPALCAGARRRGRGAGASRRGARARAARRALGSRAGAALARFRSAPFLAAARRLSGAAPACGRGRGRAGVRAAVSCAAGGAGILARAPAPAA